MRASGIDTLEALDVGGGLGVRYHNEKAPTPKAFADAVVPAVQAATQRASLDNTASDRLAKELGLTSCVG